MTPHSLKICQGYGAIQKEKIKYAYPKKVCHMLRHVKKKRENKRCIPKEGMPHAQACQKKKKKEKIAPYPKRKKNRDGA